MQRTIFDDSPKVKNTELTAIVGWSALAFLVIGLIAFALIWDHRARHAEPTDLAVHRRLDAAWLVLRGQSVVATRLGDLQKDPARLAEAARLIRQARALDPGSVRALYLSGIERLAATEPAAAIRELEQAIALGPAGTSIYLALGSAYSQTKDYACAETAYRSALQLDPKSFEALDNLGQTLWLLGREEEAKATYRMRLEAEGVQSP